MRLSIRDLNSVEQYAKALAGAYSAQRISMHDFKREICAMIVLAIDDHHQVGKRARERTAEFAGNGID
jgi:hypothetical protein